MFSKLPEREEHFLKVSIKRVSLKSYAAFCAFPAMVGNVSQCTLTHVVSTEAGSKETARK
jgi:hypothetical protein